MNLRIPLAQPGTTRRQVVRAAVSAGMATMLGLHSTRANALSGPAGQGKPSKENDMFAFVGSRTTRERKALGDGITVFRVDPASGALQRLQVLGDLVNPSYLTLNASGTRLYAVHGDLDYVSAFRVDLATGRIELLNRQTTQGSNPVHLALDPSGSALVVSNHLGGSLAVLPVGPDGELLPLHQLVKLEGPIGPHRVEQTQAKPHFNGFDPSGRFVVVPDKGLDRVFAFRFEGGRLTPAAQPFAAVREGSGPRHHVFHPWRSVAYVANELDSTVTVYSFDANTGALSPLQRVSVLPESYTGDSRAAGIMIDPKGESLYVSNRRHDSLSLLRIDAESGLLKLDGTTPSGGAKPRFFTLSPSGRHLYALNEDSHQITPFAVDPSTGRLHRAGAPAACGSPVCMVFASAI